MWAIVQDNVVGGFIESDTAPEPEQYPAWWDLIDVGDNPNAIQIGWRAVKGGDEWHFSAPQEVTLTQEERERLNFAERAGRASQAANKMAPIMGALDLSQLDGSIGEEARKWQSYYNALLEVDVALENPDWPEYPQEGI